MNQSFKKAWSYFEILACILGVLVGQSVYAGNEGPLGGDGWSAVFNSMRYELGRALTLNPNLRVTHPGDEVELDPNAFMTAAKEVAVIIWPEADRPTDRLGSPRTAIYDPMKRVIYLHEDSFKKELIDGTAYYTVFHESIQAMGLDDENNAISRQYYNQKFFIELVQTSDTLKRIQALATRKAQSETSAKSGDGARTTKPMTRAKLNEKIDLIEEESKILRAKLVQNVAELRKLGKQYIQDEAEIAKALNKAGNQVEKVLSNLSMIPMPFPSILGKEGASPFRLGAATTGVRSRALGAEITTELIEFLRTENREIMDQLHDYLKLRKKVVTQYLEADE